MPAAVTGTVERHARLVRLWELNWGLIVALGSCIAFWATLVSVVTHLG